MEMIVFFSHSNENFVDGKKQILSIGNTKIIANKLSHIVSIQLYELIPIHAYPKEYDLVVDMACREKKNNVDVGYQTLDIQQKKIETLFLGFPNWWGTYPQIISTFLNQTDLDYSTIFPFCTHEGSGFGNSISDLKQQCPKSVIKDGLSIRGSRVNRSDTAIKNWIRPYLCAKSKVAKGEKDNDKE